jgi:hypothetical protein
MKDQATHSSNKKTNTFEHDATTIVPLGFNLLDYSCIYK